MQDIRTIFLVSISSLMAYLSPINGVIYAVTFAFVLNFAAGYFADLVVNHEHFKFKKAFSSITEACVFVVFVAAVYSIGEHLDDANEALICISIVTYVVLFFYATNVFRNLKLLFPKSQWIAFCYWAISFEFIKKVPLLEKFQKQGKEVANGKN